MGQKLANAYELFDMHGNVYEWCHDWYTAYPVGSATNPAEPTIGEYRMIRGYIPPGYTLSFMGFRVSLGPVR